jgi:hypothetical protein
VTHVDEARGRTPWLWVRVALAAFVAAWLLGPDVLREQVPILLVFAIALGLELHFLVSALRGGPRRQPDRHPQDVDRERYGYDLERYDLERYDLDEEEPDGWDAPFADDQSAEREVTEAADEATAAPLDPVDVEIEAQRPIARAFRRFALGLGVIAALGTLIWLVDGHTGWTSLPGDTRAAAVARFSREASRIAGKPVAIRCDTARDYVGAVQHADGVAVVGGDLAILTPEICDDLYRLAFRHETTGSRTGRALAVLAHEAWHLRGVTDESVAECYGLQSGVALGERLGLGEGTARQLMRQQLIENALRGPDTLQYRISSECRNGGRLDLDPASSRFP